MSKSVASEWTKKSGHKTTNVVGLPLPSNCPTSQACVSAYRPSIALCTSKTRKPSQWSSQYTQGREPPQRRTSLPRVGIHQCPHPVHQMTPNDFRFAVGTRSEI